MKIKAIKGSGLQFCNFNNFYTTRETEYLKIKIAELQARPFPDLGQPYERRTL